MKSILALTLFVGVALCNSSAYYGWRPHKEFTYRFESQTLTGIPEIESQYAGLKLVADVKVQSFEDFSLRIKLENPRYKVVNEKLIMRNGIPRVPKPESELPEYLRRPLTTPFLVHLKRGVVENFFVEENEPVLVTNIKKALLSQLQLDLTGSRRPEVVSNHITKQGAQQLQREFQEQQGQMGETISYFSTYESNILGDCETSYTINPLPKYQGEEIENRIKNSEDELHDEGVISSERSQGQELCEGKKYWEIVKTKNFDNCKEMPVYQGASGIKIKCDFTKAQCRDTLTHTSSTRYIICGSPEEFYIREATTTNKIMTNPLGWVSSQEKMTSTSKVNLQLLKIEQNDRPMPKPEQTKTERSLIFQYPKESLTSSKSSTRALTPGQETEEYGFEPLMPKPDMRSGSPLFPSPLPIQELKQKITQEIEKAVKEIFKSPESCTSKSDIAGTVSTVSFFLRPLSYEELKEVERHLSTAQLSPDQREIARELFLDILSMTASNPAVSLIKEKVERQEMSERTAAKVLQATIRNVKTPTQELLRELLKLVKNLESRRHMYNIAIVQLSNLVNKACVNTNSQTNNFPVRIYGLFCRENSQFITKEYIPYLVEKMQETRKESQKMVLIAALGKVGHKEILLPMVRIIESQKTHSPMARSLTVYMLKRLSKSEPSLVRPILLALIDNPAENPEVRIAAVSVLPWTQPSTAELQKIAVRSWFEPSKQVASFIYTTLKSVTETEVPELKPVGRKAEGLMHMVKPFQYGIQYSKNAHAKQFIDYLRAASSVETSIVNSEESLSPVRLAFSSHLYGSTWEMEGLSLGAYTKGMDWLVDSLWKYMGYKSEVSEQVKEQLERINEKLRIKKRDSQTPASLIYLGMMGYDRIYSFDKEEIYNEIISKVSEEVMSSGQAFFNEGKHFNYTHAKYLVEVDAVGPTVSGFPIMTRRNIPLVVGIKGYAKGQGQYGEESSAEVKIVPVINAKVIGSMGVISPFTEEFLGAGVEVSMHMTLPLKMRASLSKKGEFELRLSSPEEINNQFEALHVFVKPFTVVKSLKSVQPMSKSKSFKVIKTEKETEKYEKEIGRSLGLKSIMTVESDYPTPYFANFWNIVKKHNIYSLLSLASMPPSVRFGSFKIEFDPRQSETKEVELYLSSAYGKRSGESQFEIQFPSEQEVSQEKKEEIKQICKERHPEEHEEQQMCKEHLMKRIVHKEKQQHKMKEIMEQTQFEFVQGFCVHGSLKSRSSSRTAVTTVLFTTEKNGQRESDSQLHISFSTPQSSNYEIDMKAEAKWAQNKNRWEIEPILQEPKELKTKVVIVYGKSQQSKKEITLEGKLWKSQELKESIKESQEMKKCRDELQKGRELSSVCEELRHQASSADKINLKVSIPEELKDNWLVEKLGYGMASQLFPVMYEKFEPEQHQQSNEFELTAQVERKGSVAQVWISTPSGQKFQLKNMTIPQPLEGVLPISLRNGVANRLIQDVSRDQVPASCRLDSTISSFDNKTYEYNLNECQHLLFKDCSSFERKFPLAVLAKNSGSENKEVKILSSTHIIELSPKGGRRGVEVKVDGQREEVPTDSPLVKRSKITGQVILEIIRFHDDVVLVLNPVEGLKVLYDGKMIEVVAPQQLRNRACGLCGDLNGENTGDLKSPQECIMSSPRLAAYSYILQGEGECSGIPSQDKEQYEKDMRSCHKLHSIRTPLQKLAQLALMRKTKQESLVHVVEVQRNQICVSKSRVRSCPIGTRPTQTKKQELSFSCMVRTTGKAQQIVKRVQNGDEITEMAEMPIQFTKSQQVPVKCVEHPSELKQQQTRRQEQQELQELEQQVELERQGGQWSQGGGSQRYHGQQSRSQQEREYQRYQQEQEQQEREQERQYQRYQKQQEREQQQEQEEKERQYQQEEESRYEGQSQQERRREREEQERRRERDEQERRREREQQEQERRWEREQQREEERERQQERREQEGEWESSEEEYVSWGRPNGRQNRYNEEHEEGQQKGGRRNGQQQEGRRSWSSKGQTRSQTLVL